MLTSCQTHAVAIIIMLVLSTLLVFSLLVNLVCNRGIEWH